MGVLLSAIYNVVVAPIETVIEVVFCASMVKLHIGGVMGAIAAVSLAVNFLALPLYNIADALQKKERDTQNALSRWSAHIKSNFSGDERFMTLQTYWRQNNWHPLMALRSSLSILIEIPFFIAAYHFLSRASMLRGAQFAFLPDLGAPDALIALPMALGGSSVRLNLLPIVMTAVNVVSAAVYLRGARAREKAQTYALALVFLVILYNSPSGLVCYWILNNLFSLAKNVVNARCARPARFVHGVVSALLVALAAYLFAARPEYSLAKRLAVAALALLVSIAPFAAKALRRLLPRRPDDSGSGGRGQFALFFFSSLALALLCGLTLPSSAIATSPAEFSFIGRTDSPLAYVAYSLEVFAGLFLFWPLCVYKMFGEKTRRRMAWIFAFVLASALLNAYLFKPYYGTVNAFFELDTSSCLRDYSAFYTALPVAAALALAGILLAAKKFNLARQAATLALAVCAAEAALSCAKISKISRQFAERAEAKAAEKIDDGSEGPIEPIYHLSKDGRNVVVLFLDRAISSFFPYIVKQFPEIEGDFDGFVFYPNTVSFSNKTAKATPAMVGGYEYTPEAMNARSDEYLVDKMGEAALVMARLFREAGFSALVSDPPCDHGNVPFEKYGIHVERIGERYTERYLREAKEFNGEGEFGFDTTVRSHIVAFCALEASPPVMRATLYQNANYYRQYNSNDLLSLLPSFAHLFYLGDLTDGEAEGDSYIFITNETTHSDTLLKEPDYVPANDVSEGHGIEGWSKWRKQEDVVHWHINVAGILQTARWLRRLKEIGCYDNTRVVIVADHGRNITTPAFDGMKRGTDYAMFNPLLMEKDFGAHGKIKTDRAFMTNADTLFLAKEGLPIGGANPFTGRALSETADKTEARVYSVIDTSEMGSGYVKKKTWRLDVSAAYSVRGDIFDEANWTPIN